MAKSTPVTMEMMNQEILPRIEEAIDEKFKENFASYRNEVLGFKDEVIREIKKATEESVAVNHQYDRTNKRVDNHETRITALEAA